MIGLFSDEDFHTPAELVVEEIAEEKKLSLFDFLNAITFSKKDLLVDEVALRAYTPYVINMGLMNSMDMILYANEMNRLPNISKEQHYDFLKHSIRKGKRYDKWIKPTKLDNLDIVAEFYDVSKRVAKQYLPMLSEEDIKGMIKKLDKGGLK